VVRELRALECDLIKVGHRFGFSPTATQLSAPPAEDEVETDEFAREFGRASRHPRRPSASQAEGWISTSTRKATPAHRRFLGRTKWASRAPHS
jgi:hypothetical protein